MRRNGQAQLLHEQRSSCLQNWVRNANSIFRLDSNKLVDINIWGLFLLCHADDLDKLHRGATQVVAAAKKCVWTEEQSLRQ